MGGRGSSSKFDSSLSRSFVKDAIAGYQNRDYLDINRILRDKRNTRLDVVSSKEMLNKKIKALDIATTKTPLAYDKILYRGVEKGKLTARILKQGIGYKFTDKGFTSTSKQKTEISNEQDYNFIIRAPKGQKGIDVNYLNRRGKWYSEKEYILPRNTSFKVRKITQSSHNKYSKDIYLDIVS